MSNIDKALEERISHITSEVIYELLDKSKDVNLNNLVEGFEKNYYQLSSNHENNLNEYDFVFLINYGVPQGYALRSGRHIEDRDLITYQFCRFLTEKFKNLNEIILFNTFQNMLISTYETYGIYCIGEKIASLSNPLIIVKGKKSVDNVLLINRINFFRSFFKRTSLLKNINNQDKVYLLYDLNDDLFKIGFTTKTLQTRKKGVADSTLRGKEPKIDIISSWNATHKIETKLKTKYLEYRKRGEWFDLNPRLLKELNEYMIEYPSINYNS